MAEFSQAIEAQMRGATVRTSELVKFDFRSQTVRLWQGFGTLLAGGHEWQGIGSLGMISAVSSGPGLAVEEMTFSLFGDERLIASVRDEIDEAIGREVSVYKLFFDIRQTDELGNWVEWQPLDEPFQIFWGTMGPLKVERPEVSVDSRASRVVSVTGSNAFLNRARPAFGYYSDSDQKARSPSDNMFIYAYKMADTRVRWPKF